MSDVTVLGMEEILKKLKKLPERVQKNVLTGAVRASAKPMIKEAKRLVPVKSGTLKKSIGIRKRRSKNKNIIHFSVAPITSVIKKLQIANGVKKPYDYAWRIEFGNSVSWGNAKNPPIPFMRPAFEKEGENTIKATKEYMNKRTDKEIAKL